MFINILKFVVKDCDFSIGELDEEGYEDEYVVCKFELIFIFFVVKMFVFVLFFFSGFL